MERFLFPSIFVKQIFFPHFFISFKLFFPFLPDFIFCLSFQNVRTYLSGTHQQIEPLGAGKEFVCTSAFLVETVEQKEIRQTETFRSGSFPKVDAPACLSFMERIFVEARKRLGSEAEIKLFGGKPVEVWTSDYLERKLRASSHTDRSALERTERGKTQWKGHPEDWARV